jgi:hypothetical protein
MDEFYKPTPDGLIGNEDCGQMSAWYVFSAAGFYPVTPGSKIYAIGSPLFPEVRFRFENGKTFVVRASEVSETNVYIQSATLNGKPYAKPYLGHDDVMTGGELVLAMGPQANRQWGLGLEPVASGAESGFQSAQIPVPVIRGNKTFRDQLTIGFQNLAASTSIHYTTDGSEPTSKSTRYVRPFLIDKNTIVKARAIDARGRQSSVVTGSFHRIPHDWKLTLLSEYSSQYTAGGDSALIDGLRGTMNWTSGAWQGYWEKDLVAVVDLGKVQRVSEVGAGFLQDIGSWIWFPRRVEIELSVDGQSFTRVASVVHDTRDTTINDYVQTITPQNARYVRVRAANSGKNTWIFADEILIK